MYGVDDERTVFSRAMALAGRIFIETIPQWLAVGAMLGLIFGGCCSNVFALEAIIKVEPASGASPHPSPRRPPGASIVFRDESNRPNQCPCLYAALRYPPHIRPIPLCGRHWLHLAVRPYPTALVHPTKQGSVASVAVQPLSCSSASMS